MREVMADLERWRIPADHEPFRVSVLERRRDMEQAQESYYRARADLASATCPYHEGDFIYFDDGGVGPKRHARVARVLPASMPQPEIHPNPWVLIVNTFLEKTGDTILVNGTFEVLPYMIAMECENDSAKS